MTILHLVAEGEFPHGLRCMDCSREIKVGEAYTSRPDGVTQGGSLTEELLCIGCATE